MRLTVRYVILLIVIILISSLFFPVQFKGIYPHPAGPILHNDVSRVYRQEINRRQPKIVLLGDSMLSYGVDEAVFQRQIGAPVYKLDIPGSTSALWYMVIKSNIINAENPPHILVILFRPPILTSPTFRVNGKYLEKIDAFASPKDELLLERAYLVQLDPLQILMQEYFPLYTYRAEIREALDAFPHYMVPSILGCNSSCANHSMTDVLGEIQPDILGSFMIQADQNIYTPAQLDFAAQVEYSFLPEMIRLAQEDGIELIFVRMPTNIFPDPATEPDGIETYVGNLARYLEQRNIPFLDLSQAEGIGPEHFSDPYHMNAEGKAVFTIILANALKNLIP